MFWNNLVRSQSLSIDFIEKHMDKFSWTDICSRQSLTNDFLVKHIQTLTNHDVDFKIKHNSRIKREDIESFLMMWELCK
jgi:predicted DNA-binding protein (MmcQ/YjbR family)